MEYTIEELFPILGQLAEKYTAFESTSIPYETAEQLTEAVLYCIREAEQVQTNALVQAEGLSARQAYAIGAAADTGLSPPARPFRTDGDRPDL